MKEPLQIQWEASKPSVLKEFIDECRPKLKCIYTDPILNKEVKVYEERWCY